MMELLYKSICEYENFIEMGNSALYEAYDLSIPPLKAKVNGIIPKSGELEVNNVRLSFWFHGMGCQFNFSGIIVDFDYTYKYFEYKGFDLWKLHNFILSVPEKYDSLKDKDIYDKSIKQLELEGRIIKNANDNLGSYDYELVK